MRKKLNTDIYFDIANGDVSVAIRDGDFVDASVVHCGAWFTYDTDEKDDFLEYIGLTWDEVLEIASIEDAERDGDMVNIRFINGKVKTIPMQGWKEALEQSKLTKAQKWVLYRKIGFRVWQRNQDKSFKMFGRYPHQLSAEETAEWQRECL